MRIKRLLIDLRKDSVISREDAVLRLYAKNSLLRGGRKEFCWKTQQMLAHELLRVEFVSGTVEFFENVSSSTPYREMHFSPRDLYLLAIWLTPTKPKDEATSTFALQSELLYSGSASAKVREAQAIALLTAKAFAPQRKQLEQASFAQATEALRREFVSTGVAFAKLGESVSSLHGRFLNFSKNIA